MVDDDDSLSMGVLILIVMDDPLRDYHEDTDPCDDKCLNPYCNG